MKILVIGSTGTIGSGIYAALKDQYEVFGAHRNSREYSVDITDKRSIQNLFSKLPKLDAVINAAGEAVWKTFDALTDEDYYIGIKSKLMGQVNLVHAAQDQIQPNGCIILTTGILADYPYVDSTIPALINGALHSFVMAAAPEMKNGIRLNVVSPAAIKGASETWELFAGHAAVSMEAVVNTYKNCLMSLSTGTVFKIY